MKKLSLLVLVLVLIAAFTFAAGGKEGETSAAGTAQQKSSAEYPYPGAVGKKATLILKDLTNPVWIQAAEGAKAAAADFGMDIEVVAPVVSNNNDEQIQLVQQAIAKKKDIMILTPADSKGIVPAVTELNNAKIPVINLNTKINNESGRANSETFVVADNIIISIYTQDMMASIEKGIISYQIVVAVIDLIIITYIQNTGVILITI